MQNTDKAKKQQIKAARKAKEIMVSVRRRKAMAEREYWLKTAQYSFEECDVENGKTVFNMAGELVYVA